MENLLGRVVGAGGGGLEWGRSFFVGRGSVVGLGCKRSGDFVGRRGVLFGGGRVLRVLWIFRVSSVIKIISIVLVLGLPILLSVLHRMLLVSQNF